MKKLFLVLTVAFLSFGITQTVSAQTYSLEEVNQAGLQKDGKYGIMVDNGSYLMASIVTGEMYKEQSKDIEFEVVLIGAVVKELADDKNLLPFIERAEKSGVRIVVCKFAMDKLGVTEDDLPKSVEITGNGFTYYYGLQELGFRTISL